MFNDRMEIKDGVAVKLECDHKYSGGMMICLVCGRAKQVIVEPKLEPGTVRFVDNMNFKIT